VLTKLDVPAGVRLLGEGEAGDRICFIESGRLEATMRLPSGGRRTLAYLGAGDAIGEIALLTGGRRTATVRTLEPTRGWMLDRLGFEALRLDGRPESIELLERIGSLAAARLRARLEAIAGELGPAPEPAGDFPPPPLRPVLTRPGPLYLASLLCFSRFAHREDVLRVVHGMPARGLERGQVLIDDGERPDHLHLVLRGAIEQSVRRGEAARRVRLAGPGRFVGHPALLDGGPSPAVARARERTVLLTFPRERVQQLLADPHPSARAFAAAVFEDVARAVREAERPFLDTVTTPGPAGRRAAA
jgi:CRP-like cAMP-binding protein